MKIILPGSIRSKKNSKRIVPLPARKSSWMFSYKNRGICAVVPSIQPSTAYIAWERDARKAAKSQLIFGFVPILGPLHVRAIAYIKGPAPDLSGMHESVGDCLQGLIWMDDKQIVSWDGSRVVRDTQNPRTEIEITEVKY